MINTSNNSLPKPNFNSDDELDVVQDEAIQNKIENILGNEANEDADQTTEASDVIDDLFVNDNQEQAKKLEPDFTPLANDESKITFNELETDNLEIVPESPAIAKEEEEIELPKKVVASDNLILNPPSPLDKTAELANEPTAVKPIEEKAKEILQKNVAKKAKLPGKIKSRMVASALILVLILVGGATGVFLSSREANVAQEFTPSAHRNLGYFANICGGGQGDPLSHGDDNFGLCGITDVDCVAESCYGNNSESYGVMVFKCRKGEENYDNGLPLCNVNRTHFLRNNGIAYDYAFADAEVDPACFLYQIDACSNIDDCKAENGGLKDFVVFKGTRFDGSLTDPACYTPTPSPLPSNTPTPSPSPTPSNTPTPTITPTPTSGATPTPTITPTPRPVCDDVRMDILNDPTDNPANLIPGQSTINFYCSASGTYPTSTYKFRVFEPCNSTNPQPVYLNAVSGTSRSVDYLVPYSGDFEAQCAVCDSNGKNCAWELYSKDCLP